MEILHNDYTCHAYSGSDKSIPLKLWIFTPDQTLTTHDLRLPKAQLCTALSENISFQIYVPAIPPKREEPIIFHQTKILNAPKNFLLGRSDISQHKTLEVSKLKAMSI